MVLCITAVKKLICLLLVPIDSFQVDVNVMTQPPSGEWIHLGTAVTDSHGKLTYTLTDEQRLNHGMYPVKCVVK